MLMGLAAIYRSWPTLSSFICFFYYKTVFCTFFRQFFCVFIIQGHQQSKKFFKQELRLKNYDLTPYSMNKRAIHSIFYLEQTDQIQNIHRELCYHARFFTATDSTKE